MANLYRARQKATPTALAEIRSDLSLLLAEMDELGLFQAGAHLAMSIHCLEQHIDMPSLLAERPPAGSC